MNSRPITLRLRSGSATPSSFFRKRRLASTKRTSRRSRAAKRLRTCSASSLRSRPLSTNTQVRRLPIARCTISAATAESTPPESAQITRPFSPTCSRTRSVASSTNERAFQSRRHPQASRKLARTLVPSSEWTTSGWKSIPYSRRAESSTAAIAFVSVAPTTLKPCGRAPDVVAVAHPDPAARGQPAEERAPGLRREDRLPVLAVARALHLPAEDVAHQLHAVADAHDRHAELEEARVAPGSAALVDAVGTAGEHDASRAAPGQGIGPRSRRQDLGVDLHLAQPARDELGVLRAEVEDEDRLSLHELPGKPDYTPRPRARPGPLRPRCIVRRSCPEASPPSSSPWSWPAAPESARLRSPRSSRSPRPGRRCSATSSRRPSPRTPAASTSPPATGPCARSTRSTGAVAWKAERPPGPPERRRGDPAGAGRGRHAVEPSAADGRRPLEDRDRRGGHPARGRRRGPRARRRAGASPPWTWGAGGCSGATPRGPTRRLLRCRRAPASSRARATEPCAAATGPPGPRCGPSAPPGPSWHLRSWTRPAAASTSARATSGSSRSPWTRARAGWTWRVGADVGHAGLLLPDQILFAPYDAVLYSFRRGGNLAWRRALPSRPLSAPLSLGGYVLVACLENELVAFDSDTGARTGGLRTSAEIRTPPIVAGGYVVVGLRDRSVIAYALPGTLPPTPTGAAGCPTSARPVDCPHAHELSHGPALPGHGCRLGRAGQAPDHGDGRVHRARRLRHRVDRLAVDPRPGHGARRDRPRRRGRQRSQPGDGAGHRRPHAAHADAPDPVRAHPARRGAGLRRPADGHRARRARRALRPPRGGGGARDLGELPVRLHASQAPHAPRDPGRGRARRTARP